MGRMPEKLVSFTSKCLIPFPTFICGKFTPRKTYCFFAPGFVIFTFPEDAANISMKLWEFGSRTACCVHKGTVSLWHQQNQNCKVSILQPALMAVKIVFFKSFIYWSTKASSVGTCFPWLTAKAGLEDCGGQVLRHSCAETAGGSAFGYPVHKWWSLGNPHGQSILPLNHQETHLAGAVALGLTCTCQMCLSCWCFAQTGAAASHKCSVCPATSCPEGEKFPDPAKYQHQEHVPRRQGHTAASMCQHSFQQAAWIPCSHTQSYGKLIFK